MSKFHRKLQKVNARLEQVHLNTMLNRGELTLSGEGKLEHGDQPPASADHAIDTEGYRERDEKAIRHISESGEWTPPDPREYAQQLREHQEAGRITTIDSIGHISAEIITQPDRSHKAERKRKAQQKKLAKFYRNQHHIARHMP